MSTVTDTQLVNAYLSGDRSALAGMYDLYGATLYDTAAAMTGNRHDAADVVQDVFVVAAERLGQLRDPSRLKPWLFAILRNEVYRRTKRGRRAVPTDFTEAAAEMQLPPDEHDAAAGVEYDELAALVRGAAAGLDERDQLVLELSVRQGLDGADLADALGVSAQQSYGLVHRMRQRTERSLAAFCVARRGRKECDELAAILRGWDEQFSVLIRKRVARHIDQCEICERTRKTVVPLALFAGAPAFAAPPALRDRVLAATSNIAPAGGSGAGGAAAYGFGRPGGFPSALRHLHKLALIVLGAAALLLLTAGGAVYVLADSSDGQVATGPPPSSTTTTTDVAGTTTIAAAPVAATTVPITVPTTTADTATTLGTTTTTTSTTSTTSTTLPITTSTTPAVGASPVVPGATTTTTTATTTLPAPPPTTTRPTTTAPPPTTTTTTPGTLRLSSGSIDLGPTRPSATVTLSNPGGAPITWYSFSGPLGFRGGTSPFTISPTQGELAPGSSTTVTVFVDRTWPTEGPVARSFTFYGTGADATVDATATIARPPVLKLVPPPTHICISSQQTWISWQAGITDESPPITAGITITTPAGQTEFEPLLPDGDTYYGGFDIDGNDDGQPDLGVFAWTVSAVDRPGNRTTQSGTVSVGTDGTHC